MRRIFYMKWAFLQIFLYVFPITCRDFKYYFQVKAFTDCSAKMPCEAEKKYEKVEYVFWFKKDERTVLYMLDAKNHTKLQDAIHRKNISYAERVQFHFESPIPYLQMDKLTEEDNGTYYCKVDYFLSVTEVTKVDLVVIEPPKRVVFHGVAGDNLPDFAEPYKEVSDVTLSCEDSIWITEYFLVEALVDGSAKMPCEVEKKDDIVEFVFWYKNYAMRALYTLDALDSPNIQNASHIINETYADCVHFHLESPIPYLQMDQLTEENSGDYYCRVDYLWSVTKVTKVELVVIVPPHLLVIEDGTGKEIRNAAGPYNEGSDITLICEAQKGYPSPNVTWWRDGKLWDNTFKTGPNSVVNEMTLRNLSKQIQTSTFHCKAENTKLAPPLIKEIVMDIYHGYETVWHYFALTAGAGVAASFIVAIAVWVVYCSRLYFEKKHRPMDDIYFLTEGREPDT